MLAPWKIDGAVRIERKAVYTFRARIAEQWCKGRVLLAGDAAHQTPPFAGQGMCSGLRDAANLAWKLAAVTKGEADQALLETYQPERAPNLRATIDMAIMMGQMVCTTSRLGAAVRDMKFSLARMLGKLPDRPPDYPPIGPGAILTGSRGAGELISASGSERRQPVGRRARAGRLVDHPWGSWQGSACPICRPLRKWLDHQSVETVLVRPDRYIFGAGECLTLEAQWQTTLGRAPPI
jgi:3-(3-hydroxy-phenyl)propionate hydroxylase